MLKLAVKYFYLILIIAGILTVSVFLLSHYHETQGYDNEPVILQPELIIVDEPIIKNQIEVGSGVVPHHLLAEEMIDNFWRKISNSGEPETIILLSPDHYNNGWYGQENNLLSLNANDPEFNNLQVDQYLMSELDNLSEASSYISLDHGVTAHLPFIKKYLPETKILPILIPPHIDLKTIEGFTRQIAKKSSNQTIIVASVDFSHYLPKKVADFHDVKSISTLINFKINEFQSLEVDCWQCLYAARFFSRLRGKESVDFLAHDNSANLTNLDNPNETTSYVSLLFNKGDMKINKNLTGQTMIFVGDIMLDRGVEALMNKKSVFYPFEQVNRFFKGVDYVIGNLEGPIVKDPPKFAGDSLRFAFSPDILKALKFSSFNIFSLANNHTLNMGQDGLKQTREFLGNEKIGYMGDPIKCSQEYIYQKDDFIFLGLNATYNKCSKEELVNLVSEVNKENSDKFIIISIHWGVEYKTSHSSGQEKLARQLIDSGADLIIGHHPHVVQDIEIYKNKLIFYSLGNFIFDQYFSQKTQQGLVIGFEKYSDKLIYRIFPVNLTLSQPHLMSESDNLNFLKDLAAKSSEELQESIKNAIIELSIE